MINSAPVDFPNRRGQRLAGVLHGEPGALMAISCHGMLSTKEGAKHRLLADTLAARGIATLRFDFAGRGESEGDMEEMTYSSEMADLDAAVDYVSANGAQRIGVFGSSMGGAVALLAAARDERITAVATLAAVAYPDQIEERYPRDCAGWRERGYLDLANGRIGIALLDDALQHDVVSAARVIRAQVLVMHGVEDQVVPPSDAHDIAAALRNVSLVLVDGADHSFSNPIHMRPAVRDIAEYLERCLRNGSQ